MAMIKTRVSPTDLLVTKKSLFLWQMMAVKHTGGALLGVHVFFLLNRVRVLRPLVSQPRLVRGLR